MSRVLVLVLSSVCVIVAGCSGGEPAAETSDAGSDARPDGASPADTALADTAFPPADTAPPICWFLKSGRAEERKCDECSDVSCKAERETCYGPAYLSGTFDGVCKSYITCQCGCSESDDTCQQACKIEASRDCDTCVAKIDDCEKTKCAPVCAPTL